MPHSARSSAVCCAVKNGAIRRSCFALAVSVLVVRVNHEITANLARDFFLALALDLLLLAGNHRLELLHYLGAAVRDVDILHADKHGSILPIVEFVGNVGRLGKVGITAADGVGHAPGEERLSVALHALDKRRPLEFDSLVLDHGRHVGQQNRAVALVRQ
jgi:hypothetical protein